MRRAVRNSISRRARNARALERSGCDVLRVPILLHRLFRAAPAAVFAFLSFAFAGTVAATPRSDAGDDAVITADPVARALHVSGAIGPRFDRDLHAWLRRHPATRTVVIRSPGGLRAPALRAARLIDARGLTLRVDGRCASACALLWAAVESREMTRDSRLGLHSSHLPGALPLPEAVKKRIVARNDRQTDRVFRAGGFPERLVAIGRRTPPSTMSWLHPLELEREGVRFVLVEPEAGALAQYASAPAPVHGATSGTR